MWHQPTRPGRGVRLSQFVTSHLQPKCLATIKAIDLVAMAKREIRCLHHLAKRSNVTTLACGAQSIAGLSIADVSYFTSTALLHINNI
jgi:hypothetical protein